ncbi:tRNA-dihydrouridine synthase C [Marinospirillum alkaliphilum DSM 21637]|uniref:tRNA-dihydrouridine(16) synthase n=2 Tax=Marinospirillum TaxID=64968 RepID=A0A1K1W147_9GAMM|nr:tRNA-dihydrouridine synthase family protein [Marinospirillum alkaliphilum]SFX31090.1 tRNA-dihydrouridine synthase C [Marinospirillum alkaliphilum DSM 21637]
MEGVIDALTRDLITRQGGWSFCVTEFVRITQDKQPRRVFHRICPELRQNALTPAGVPVHLQLLGSDPEMLAINARVAASAGAKVVDLNFGCPAKTVNRHLGGASLLRYPEQVYAAARAVADALRPLGIPLTAKMRLGYQDTELALDNARALQEAGISQLVVHARTKVQGYKPPAQWEWVARIAEVMDVPVLANGEIWTLEDYQRCVAVSGIRDVMLGRTAMTDPWLARQIRQHHAGEAVTATEFGQVLQLLVQWLQQPAQAYQEDVRVMRTKQWLVMLRLRWGEAAHQVFDACKRCETEDELIGFLDQAIRIL